MKQVLFNLLLAFFISGGFANAATNTLHDKPFKTTPTSTDETYVWDTGTSTLKKTTFAPLLVGDCTGFPCLDGTSDGGNYIKLWAGTGSYWTALQGGSPTANRSWRLPIAAPPAAGATYLMNMDEYGQMGFVDPDTIGGGAAAIDELTDVDTTGKATGKILKFDTSGNLVVGNDDTGSGSVPSGTVNGQVLIWATDQWVASTAPWLTTALLSTENTWTAVQNFNSGLTATGLTQNLTSWGDWTFGGTQIVNASGTGDNQIWPASTIITALEGKSNTTHNHSGVYEPADSTIIKVSEIDSLAEFEALLGWSPGSSGINEVDSDPSFNSMATGVAVVSKASGDLFVKTSTGGYTIAGVYTADPLTYGLTVDFVGATGSDKITLGGMDYSVDTTITGLSGVTSFTVVPDTGRNGDCTGTGISGTAPNKSADMSASRSMICTFSEEEVILAQQVASSSYSNAAVYGGESRIVGQSFTPTVSGTLRKIRFYASSNGANANVTLRVGTSTNLITDTVDSAVVHVEGTKALYEVMFTGISVTVGVPVYIGITNSGDYNSSVIVYGSNAASYSDGSLHTSSSGYPMVPGTSAYDLYFEAVQ